VEVEKIKSQRRDKKQQELAIKHAIFHTLSFNPSSSAHKKKLGIKRTAGENNSKI